MRYRTIFMGTPDFAIPSLQVVFELTGLLAIFTQPDKKRGRGQKLSASPVKSFGLEHGIEVYQPNRLKDLEVIETIRKFAPDFIIVVAYGKILPPEVLEIPRYCCINVHGSLLPKYRGAAPIQWALINGEQSTGISTMKMNDKLDAGDILLQREIEVEFETTFDELHDRLKDLGAEVLKETIEKFQLYSPRIQEERFATYTPMIRDSRKKKKGKKKERVTHGKYMIYFENSIRRLKYFSKIFFKFFS